MYGLLLEGIADYIKSTYGESQWELIRKSADLEHHSFSTHQQYSEQFIPHIITAAHDILNVPKDDLAEAFGVYFVSFVGQYGYDRIMRVLGRHMRDFLNGLDNIHEYLRFSYPKLQPPSFFCENESKTGLTLHYRSKRLGFVHYVKGQIKQVGKMFYETNVDIDVVREDVIKDTLRVVFQLHFNNTAFKEDGKTVVKIQESLPIRSDIFFEFFPFNIVYSQNLTIRNVGSGLSQIIPDLPGKKMTQIWTLIRPLVEFSWSNVIVHTNNIFELRSVKPVKRQDTEDINKNQTIATNKVGGCLQLKGQMMFMDEWNSIIFLGTPVMQDLEAMFQTGLFINDLSMHDSSRDLVLAGTQQSAELKLALDQEQQKSAKLEESMKKLDVEMKRTDELLYQMIPKAVADRLRRGEAAVSTCEIFENVTILFSDVVGFTTICSRISPMQVVTLLNGMYSKFDHLTEYHGVYKVETIGDAYMIVSGTPEKTEFHAEKICNMAMDMIVCLHDLKDPSTQNNIQIRVGVHSGTVVAGVVGLKMPRYCLFGDTVNTASRMESNSAPMKIHISETTREILYQLPYIIIERGSISVKGKGAMKTYWLNGKKPNAKTRFKSAFEDGKNQIKMSDMDDIMNTNKENLSLYAPATFEEITQNLPEIVIQLAPPINEDNNLSQTDSSLSNSLENSSTQPQARDQQKPVIQQIHTTSTSSQQVSPPVAPPLQTQPVSPQAQIITDSAQKITPPQTRPVQPEATPPLTGILTSAATPIIPQFYHLHPAPTAIPFPQSQFYNLFQGPTLPFAQSIPVYYPQPAYHLNNQASFGGNPYPAPTPQLDIDNLKKPTSGEMFAVPEKPSNVEKEREVKRVISTTCLIL